jgi:branched-chain amino acid transport system substrate-binding protein
MGKSLLRTMIGGLAGAFAVGVTLAMPSAHAADNVVRIPVAVALTGPIATFGQEILHGAMLGAEDFNKGGGLKSGPWAGDKIEIVPIDSRGDPTEAANIAQQLVLNNDYVVVLGDVFSSSCLAALPIYEEAKLTLVMPICSNPTITERYKSAIRLIQDDKINGLGQMAITIGKFHPKKIGLLYANNDYGRGAFEESKKYLDKQGTAYVAEPYNEGETDYTAIISRFAKNGVDLIAQIGFYTESALQRRQAVQQDFDVPFVGNGGSVSSEFIRLGGKEAEGAYVVDFMKEGLDTPKLKELNDRVGAAWKETFNLYHRQGYDAIGFIAVALARAKDKSREAVNAALRATKTQGLTYLMAVNAQGDLIVPLDHMKEYFSLKKVEGGKFVDEPM